jgi:GT2 family glycosyltransferase
MNNKDTYVVCACENVKIDKYYEDVTNMEDFEYKHIMWYQHSELRNRMLHFCTSISREQYDNIGGFDRRYMYGVGVDDVDFLKKVQDSGMPITIRDDLVTLHQDHGKQQDFIPDHNRLWNINKNLYSAIHG